MNEICLTFDTDWVNDFVLQKTVDILRHYKLKATFFATHDSSLLRSLNPECFEIALHPNFETTDGYYDLTTLDSLKTIYPSAVGMRSHTLFFSSRLIPRIETLGLRYESNIFLWHHPNLQVVDRTKNLKSIPFIWSDDKHVELEKAFTLDAIPNLKMGGLKVLNFHPIHVFLNTCSQNHYLNSKKVFNLPEIEHKIYYGQGIRSLFINVCEYIKREKFNTFRMKDFI